MGIIYKSKIKCIIETIIKPRLLKIFKSRWLVESQGQEWKSNAEFSKILIELGGVDIKSKNYSSYDVENIKRGSLHLFTVIFLLDYLLHSNYNQLLLDQPQLLSKQNKIIKSLSNLILEFNDMDDNYSMNESEYNEYLSTFKELLVSFDNSTTASPTTSATTIEIEINNKLNSIQDDKEQDELYFNEEVAISIKERGNKEFTKKNYKDATDIYQDAIALDGISDNLKGILLLNISKAYLGYSRSLVAPKCYSKRHEDYEIIQVALVNSLLSITHRPTWVNAYFTIGKIYSRLGEYYKSNKYFNSLIVIDNQVDSEITKQSQEYIIENNKKLSSKSNKSNGSRDFENEAKVKLGEIGDLITSRFKGLELNKNWLMSHLEQTDLLGIPNISTPKNNLLLLKRTNEKIVLSKADIFYQRDQDVLAKEYYSRCIGNETEWAQAYLKYFYYYVKKPNEEYNFDFMLALLLKASMYPVTLKLGFNVPTELKSYVTDNISVTQIYSELGKVYFHGYYDQDYDFEKAFYYFSLAASNSDGLYDKHYNFAFFSLGLMYSYGYHLPSSGVGVPRKSDIVKAIQIWKIGKSMGDATCAEYLDKLSIPTETTNDQHGNQGGDESRNLGIDILNHDYKSSFKPINLNEIKELSMTGKSDYANLVTLTYNKVNQFSKLVDTYSKLSSKKQSDSKLMLDTIEPLANAYKDYESFCFIRISISRLEITKKIIDSLLKSNATNLNVRIVWLGLNRFIGSLDEKIRFSKDSLKYCGQDSDDKLIFIYYQCIFLLYQGKFEQVFKLSDAVIRNISERDLKSNTTTTNKDVFIYLSTSVIKHLDNNNEINVEVTPFEQNYINRAPKDDPHLANLFFCRSIHHCNDSKSRNIPISLLKIGIDILESVPSSFDFQLAKFDDSFDYSSQYLKEKVGYDEDKEEEVGEVKEEGDIKQTTPTIVDQEQPHEEVEVVVENPMINRNFISIGLLILAVILYYLLDY